LFVVNSEIILIGEKIAWQESKKVVISRNNLKYIEIVGKEMGNGLTVSWRGIL